MWALKSSSTVSSIKQEKIFPISPVQLHHFIQYLQPLDAVVVRFVQVPIKETPDVGFGKDRCNATQSSSSHSLLGKFTCKIFQGCSNCTKNSANILSCLQILRVNAAPIQIINTVYLFTYWHLDFNLTITLISSCQIHFLICKLYSSS